MAFYFYRAWDIKGNKLRGIIEAESKEIIVEQLLKQGFFVTEVKLQSRFQIKFRIQNLFWPNRVGLWELMIWTRQFTTLVHAGIPINRVLNLLQNQTNNNFFKKVISEVQKDLNQGLPLYMAMARHPYVFEPYYVEMIKAGELGGIFDQILDKLAVIIQKKFELKGKLRAAVLYPIILIIVTILVLIFFLLVILPGIITNLRQLGVSIPLPTQIMLEISSLVYNYFWYLLVGIIVVVGCLKLYCHTRRGRYRVDNIILNFPFVGKLIKQIIIVKFAAVLSALVSSGIPVVQAMEIVEGLVANQVIKEALIKAKEGIIRGGSLAFMLSVTEVFDPIVIHMVSAGEESGKLDKMLLYIAEYCEFEMDNTVSVMVPFIEPVLIMLVAGVVGFVVLSVALPMFEIMYSANI